MWRPPVAGHIGTGAQCKSARRPSRASGFLLASSQLADDHHDGGNHCRANNDLDDRALRAVSLFQRCSFGILAQYRTAAPARNVVRMSTNSSSLHRFMNGGFHCAVGPFGRDS